MPYENLPESEWSKMDSCVAQVQESGKSKEAAIAICYVSIAGKVDINEAIKRIDACSVKAAKDYTLDVLGVPFNTTDSDGEYFTKATNIYSAVSDTPLVLYYHTIVPGGTMDNLTAQPEVIGTAKYNHQDDAGHWWKVTLDMTKAIARQVWTAAQAGMARVSSGTAQHLKRVNPTGEITSWAVVELSLIDASAGLKPANKYAIAVPALKGQLYKSIHIPEVLPEDTKVSVKTADDTILKLNKVNTMTPEEIKLYVEQLVKEMMGDNMEAAAPATEAQAEDPNAKLKAEIKQMVEAAFAEAKTKSEAKTADVASTITNAVKSAFAKQAAEAGRLPYTEAPKVLKFADTRKYDNVSTEDLAMVIDIVSGAKMQPSQLAIKALAQRIINMPSNDKYAGYIKAAMPENALKAATDPMRDYTAIGTEWIGTAYAQQLWEKVRAESKIFGKIPAQPIPDGYSSQYFPIEGVDMSWYNVPSVTAADSTMKVPAATIPASQAVTGSKQLSIGKVGSRVMYSGELDEDALFPFAEELRRKMAISFQETLDYLVINGDTATSSNINDIGGTTYSGAPTSLFLNLNGFRKLALVTNTANSRSAAGGLQVSDFDSTLQLMGTAGLYGSDPTKVNFIIDPGTYRAAKRLPEFVTKDVAENYTLKTGLLPPIFGVEAIPSWQMHRDATALLANTAGKVDQDTQGNNLYGAILAVRWDRWKVGNKRQLKISTVFRQESDSWEIAATARWGLVNFDNEASAITYYVGV